MSKIAQSEIFNQIKGLGLIPSWNAGNDPYTGATGYLANVRSQNQKLCLITQSSYGKTLEDALKAAFKENQSRETKP
jgi:hypothetical protein